MTVVHIVLFRLKPDLSTVEVTDFCQDMVSLKDRCIHPHTGKPYILSGSGGQDNSPEGAQGGFTHGFVVEFASAADRDYYVSHDETHQAFVRKNSARFEDVRVIDYAKGVFC